MAIFESLGAGLTLLLLLGGITASDTVRVSSTAVCPVTSLKDSIFGSQDDVCPVDWIEYFHINGVIEGDEASLQRALSIVYVEESAVKPSTLSKYGVHGFPTVFLLNSTIRIRYHGPRTLDSLVTFYNDVTGIKTASTSGISLDKIGCSSEQQKHNSSDTESCPFPWARSPENLLRQETYLALATAFVLMRLLYLFFPAVHRSAQLAWRRYITNMRLRNLWEHPLIYLNRAKQVFNSLKEPCKRSNLQEGAMNAKAWASKSLASVSFGDANSSRVVSVN